LCTIVGNDTDDDGGGVFCINSTGPLFYDCTFDGNHSADEASGICFWNSTATMEDCLVFDNVADGNDVGAAVLATQNGTLTVETSTISGNSGILAGGLVADTGATINASNTIVAFSPVGASVYCGTGSLTLTCCDLYGNAGGDYVGCASGLLGGGNISADPLFCSVASDAYTLKSNSPCASGNSACGQIGAFGVACLPAVWEVCVTGGDFTTIQDAIDWCQSGDTIEICPGTYYGPGNRDVDYGGKQITVRSQSGNPFDTTIDCQNLGRGFWFHSGEDASAILEGIQVINGRATDGGAILIESAGTLSAPTIASCIFHLCTATSNGGAVAVDTGSNPTFDSCIFWYNSAANFGGGTYVAGSSASFTDCSFLQNHTDNDGGAVYCLNASGPQFTTCWINGNTAGDDGSGVCSWNSTVTLFECVIRDNIASGDLGGAVLATQGGTTALANCTLAFNSGVQASGLLVDSGVTLDVDNTIVAFGLLGPAVYCGSGTTFMLTCSDLYGNAGGDYVGCASGMQTGGNISLDPGFCDADADDYHVHSASPCLPANNSCSVLIGALDEACAPTGVPDEPELPAVTKLMNPYPNPFNPHTTIRFDLAEPARVEVAVFSVAGRRVRTLVSENRLPGVHEVVWDGRDADGRVVPSGLYFCRMSAGQYLETMRMTLIR
jgi:hypothetical protein